MKPTPKTNIKEVKQNVHDSIALEKEIVGTLSDITLLIKKQNEIDIANIHKINNGFAFTGFFLGVVLVISLRTEINSFAGWIVWQVSNLFKQITPDAKWQTLVVGPIMFILGVSVNPIIKKLRQK